MDLGSKEKGFAMKNKRLKIVLTFLGILLLMTIPLSGGDVYLVIGSDTAIWEGMSTNRFHCFYNIDLYTNPQRNAYKVMDPAFRAKLTDSDGHPLKMTWWMMAGNIFRYASNTNVPIPNIMTMYLMKTYHGSEVQTNGDELSLHYHTFRWYDYNNDGTYYWNQALKFTDCLDDFNYTLAQFLLEEQVFPVSFRSGWHYMDNDWQRYLDDYILPYSLHNDYPHKHNDTVEPIDNIYDWSQAPSAFVPYRPSPDNYQLPGKGKGWNVRSAHFWRVINEHLIDTVFAAAQKGTNQVACFWGHLPEHDFIANIERIDSIAHARIGNYPDVHFYYCTATEAMQRWRKTTDHQAPKLTFLTYPDGDYLYFDITTDEPIFQKQPFVAVKDIYENYRVLNCQTTGTNSWRTVEPIRRDIVAKAGVAVCDSLGNQSMKFIRLLPDDIFVDNSDAAHFTILDGNWQSTSSGTPWGTDALRTTLDENDSVVVEWQHPVYKTTFYNVFVQIPQVDNPAPLLKYVLQNGSFFRDTVTVTHGLPANQWFYLKTIYASQEAPLTIRLVASGKGQTGRTVAADVVKISPLVADKDLDIDDVLISFGAVSWGDTVKYELKLQNRGREPVTVKKFIMPGNVFTTATLPFSIPAMSDSTVPLYFHCEQMGTFRDSLIIESDDAQTPRITLPITAIISNYFKIVDNEDADYEEFGEWHTSNAQAYGPSSRYAWLNQNPLAYATFKCSLKKSGVYELFEIVPKTKNATDNALYEICIDGVPIDSVFKNQNEGSGSWASIGRYYFPADVTIRVRVLDSGQSTQGEVLRADAIKFLLIKEITDVAENEAAFPPDRFYLTQNYPNPFNATTTIRYHLPQAAQVRISIFNVLGERVRTLADGYQPAGLHTLVWDGKNDKHETVSSGVYYYRMETKRFHEMKKMILLK